uniref:porin n=1 Tax=uncultured Caballeronia sp. TaxID=1827198 RepID=UPI0035CC566B
SLGGAPGSVGKDQIWSLGAGYIPGPVSLGLGYINARNPNFSFYGSIPSAGTTLTSNNIGSLGSATTPVSNPAIAGYASASTTQIIAAGAAYQLGAATLGATYSNTQFRGLGSSGSSGPNPFGYSGTATFNNAEANFKYQITLAFLAGVAYNYTHSTRSGGIAGATYHQASTGADYFLSKRTDLYAIVVYQHANGTDSLAQPAVATITGQTPSSNNHQIALRIGMRHRF